MTRILLTLLTVLLLQVNLSAQKKSIDFSNIDLKKTINKIERSASISLPGQEASFHTKLNNLMDHELKAEYPRVKSYDLFDEEGHEVGSLITTPRTFYYNLDHKTKLISFYPDFSTGSYILEEGAILDWECSTENHKKEEPQVSRTDIGKFIHGDDLQSFKLAIITTGEFYAQHGNDDDVVLGEILKTVDGVNRIFERDLAFNFTLTGRVKLFSDKDTDPFTPVVGGGGSGRTIQSARAFRDEFDNDDYDLGITFNSTSDGWPGGGLAVIQAACDPGETTNGPVKARVWASSGGEANNAFTALVCHEIGHAFGARHTLNSDSEICEDAISENDSYEIGGGNTLMSYAGRCGGGDDYVLEAETVNNYFHITSLHTMSQYANVTGCQFVLPTINTPPDLTVNPCGVSDYQIPLGTPFSVRAEGSDLEGDDLTYVWEQVDEDGPGSPNAGFLGPEAANSSRGPLFRGYPPSSSPKRDFPRFFNFFFQDPFETLPNVPRDLNLRCTVRDNNAEGGAFASDEIKISVVDVGPLNVEIDSLIDTIVGGQMINVSWNDDGISSLCDRVDVSLLSLNDPNIIIPIASDVPYEDLELDYLITPGFSIDGDFHFKVECHVEECFSFYSYSRPFFSRTNNCPPTPLYFACGLDDVTANIGAEELNQSAAQAYTAIPSYSESINVENADPRSPFARLTLTDECETLVFPSGNPVTTNFEYLTFQVAESGTYRIRNNSNPFGGFILFDDATYDEAMPCASIVGSNLSESLNFPASLTTTVREWVDLDLEACVSYRLGITKIENEDITVSVSITGPSSISLEEGINLDNTFLYVVENEDNVIEAILSSPDFRSLRQGGKRVYTIQVDPETFVPDDYIGKLLVDIGIGGVCVGRSSNTIEMLLINPLPDEDMDGYHTDEDCNDQDPNINPGQSEVLNNAIDENCDGIIEGDDNDLDGFVAGVDCNDNDPNINPDAEEIINNDVDEDCDGVVNVIDEDMDGFNSDEDCNDNDASINPDAQEIANNEVDENCDGVVLVIDEDMDGFNSDVDCDDMNASINPDTEEIPNNDVDENCDGVTLVIDNDMDGFNSTDDCNDDDPTINPDAEEIPSNAVDENCDGIVLNFDADMDGFNSEDDCNDDDPAINPDAEEIANNDVDENCDGELLQIDVDMDGFNSDEDCNDDDPAINPDAEEIPNNDIDENCDGAVILIDEDMDGFNSDEDCNDMDASINPGAEEIPNNDIDEDCDGEANIQDDDMDGFNSDVDCDDTNPDINPDAPEIPNNSVDENCNGELGFTDEDMDGFNASVDCNDQDSLIFPGAVEIPNNGIDEDCDGEDLTSSLDDLAEIGVRYFPNPIVSEFTIDLGREHKRFTITSVQGQEVYRSSQFRGQRTFLLGAIPPGLYLISVYDEEDKILSSGKLIKL